MRNFFCAEHVVVELNIDKLGAQGDGIGSHNGHPVFVSNALPGETVRTEGTHPHFDATEILESSPHRQTPPCPHFENCGGCSFQHAKLDYLQDWKASEVEHAFHKAGIKIAANKTVGSPENSRRRITFTMRRDGADVVMGFKQKRSDDLVDISTCIILLPVIEIEIENIKSLAKTLVRGHEEIRISINACDNGLDLEFGLENSPSEEMTAAFVRSVARLPYLRASINGEVFVEKEKPLVRFGKATVAIPSAGFLQAVAPAEKAMVELVATHLRASKKVADLFCGAGTFALPLAEHSKVHAVELESSALDALKSASGAEGLKSITVQQRDLFELPLTAAELKPFDGLCLDPPRAGAAEQIKEISKANIRRLAYVSCNPVTLAEDADKLIGSGYTLESVTPVDQFIYSPHIEVVALFSKKLSKKQRSIFR